MNVDNAVAIHAEIAEVSLSFQKRKKVKNDVEYKFNKKRKLKNLFSDQKKTKLISYRSITSKGIIRRLKMNLKCLHHIKIVITVRKKILKKVID